MVAELNNTIEQTTDIIRACRAVGEASAIPMAALDGFNHIVRYVNPAFCLFSGKAKERFIGKVFSEVVSVGEQCVAILDKVRKTGKADTYMDTSGSLDCSYAMSPALAEDDRFVGIILQVTETTEVQRNAMAMNQALMLGSVRQHELTEAAEMLNAELQVEMVVRREAEEALIGSQKRYLDLYEFAPIGYLTLDAEGFISEININGAFLLGEVRTQILQRRFVQFVTPGDANRYRRIFKQVVKQGGRQTFDLALRRGDGSEFHAQLDCVHAVTAGPQPMVCITVVDITERKRAETEVERLAFYDSLTQLPNRRFLLGRLQAAVTSCASSLRHGAILFIDLDDFKTLNDSQGHFIGDLLLQQVALRLSACVREGDTVARLGGDEFVVMLQDLSKHAVEAVMQTSKVGEKLLAALNEPYMLSGYEYRTSGSIGAALFGGNRDSPEDLLKRADLALYSAKTSGGNGLRFFHPEMLTAATTRTVLDADLRKALKERQFVLVYQAQVDDRGRLTGAEALVRWRHPIRGLVSPAEFIPFAEDSGLIEFVGQWVLETACAQLVVWSAKPTTSHLRLAINVSAHEFYHPEFVVRVLTAIDRFGIDPRRLTLELTESAMFTTVEETLAKMTALKSRGVCFSIDDFGVGYSSLSYLKNMPLDQLKLDRSFVSDVLTNSNDAAIARTIIALGQSLNIDVIAEGVETEEQRRFLFLHGCRAFQGFLFGRPGPVEDLFLPRESNSLLRRKTPMGLRPNKGDPQNKQGTVTRR
jgi:diguanylate cyclase (GGDEF)-like protein/PAS domain S-box-containing protein